MKSFITAIFIAFVMIGGSLIYTDNVEKISKNLVNGNAVITGLIEKDDLNGAEQAAVALSEYLDNKLALLSATGNHEELDKLEIYMSELTALIQNKQKGDALAHCKALDILYEHLPKNYRLKPENIL